MSEKYVIVSGSPFGEGMMIHGPFENREAAEQWIRDEAARDYWIVQLVRP